MRVAIGLALLVALALIGNGVMAWRMEAQLQGRVAAIRASGDPASVSDLRPAPIPDDENAAAILERIKPRLGGFNLEYAQFDATPLGKQRDAAEDRGEPWTREQIDAIRPILRRYSDVEQALAKVAGCNQYASRLDFSLPSAAFIEAAVKQQSYSRMAARFFEWQAVVLLADGQHEQVVERGIDIYRIARLYESEPSIVPFLVAGAVRNLATGHIYDALAAGPVSPELCAALDEELARSDESRRLMRTLKTERAITADWTGTPPDLPYPLLARKISWMVTKLHIGAIDLASEYVNRSAEPLPDVLAQLGPADGPPASTGYGVMADLLTPGLRAVFHAHARQIAVSRALRIHIALRQFAMKHGREAKGIDELVLQAGINVDPYTGGPLKLRQTADGWAIYSVMENGVDDGGDFKRTKDYGVAPAKVRLTD
jgi:hypothetical protein